MTDWFQEFRHGLRLLARRPGFATAAIATLALGICATTAVFSVMAAVVFQPLPYGDGEDLVMLRNQERATEVVHGAAWPEYLEWREAASRQMPEMAVYIDRPFNVTGGSEPVQVWGSQVSREFFSTLRTEARVGRTFAGSEQVEGGRRAVVLSYQFWQRWLAADEAVAGRVLELDEEPFEVVGVMPQNFRSPSEPVELWVSLEPMRADLPQDFGLKFFNVVGRLADGTSVEAAKQRLDIVGERLEAEYPQANTGLSPHLVTMRHQLAGSARRPGGDVPGQLSRTPRPGALAMDPSPQGGRHLPQPLARRSLDAPPWSRHPHHPTLRRRSPRLPPPRPLTGRSHRPHRDGDGSRPQGSP